MESRLINPFTFNNVPKTNVIHLGMFYIVLDHNLKAKVVSATNKSFIQPAMCEPSLREMEISEAIDFVKKTSKFIWENNDKNYLCEEYGLTRDFVKNFFDYTGYGIDK